MTDNFTEIMDELIKNNDYLVFSIFDEQLFSFPEDDHVHTYGFQHCKTEEEAIGFVMKQHKDLVENNNYKVSELYHKEVYDYDKCLLHIFKHRYVDKNLEEGFFEVTYNVITKNIDGKFNCGV